MMAGDQLGVGHEPRHGHAYVASWVKALENDPREIRHAATDAQKAADWIVERARAIERRPPTIEREAGRLHDGRGPDVPLPPPARASTGARADSGRGAGSTRTVPLTTDGDRPGRQKPLRPARSRGHGRSRA